MINSPRILLLLSFCAACSSSAPSTKVVPVVESAKLVGVARHADGAGLAGVDVVLLPAGYRSSTPFPATVVTSDENGRFQFSGVSHGEYKLSTNSARGVGARASVSIPASKEVILDVARPALELTGVLATSDGVPIRGAEVRTAYANEGPDELYLAKADGSGAYRLFLPAGEHIIAGRASGYRFDGRVIALSESGVLNFTLEALPEVPSARVLLAGLREAYTSLSTFLGSGNGVLPVGVADAVRGARVIAIGEATHGTSEFNKVRGRMTAGLIRAGVVQAVALEAGWAEMRALNRFVTHGVGDPYEALAATRYWVWDTEETIAFARWLREYNEQVTDEQKVGFVGFDVAHTKAAAGYLLEFLSGREFPRAVEIRRSLDELNATRPAVVFSPDGAKRVLADLEALSVWLEGIEQPEGRAALEEARWAVSSLVATVMVLSAEGLDVTRRREAEMAAGILRLAGRDETRALVVWAHNEHVSFNASEWHFATMGSHLREALGPAYLSIGMFLVDGTFRAYDATRGDMGMDTVRSFRIAKPAPGTLEATLLDVGPTPFFLDVRAASESARAWASRPMLVRSIGAVYSGERALLTEVAPSHHWDAWVLVGNTSPTVPTPTGIRPRPKSASSTGQP